MISTGSSHTEGTKNMTSETKAARPALKGVAQSKSGETYEKVGKIALWKNKSKGEKAPQYKGNVTINGVKFFLSVWPNPETA